MRKSLMSAPFGIYVAEGKIDPSSTLKELGIDDLTPLTGVENTATVKDLPEGRAGGLGAREHDPPFRHRPAQRLRLHVVDRGGRGHVP
jgi:hypothetical protein